MDSMLSCLKTLPRRLDLLIALHSGSFVSCEQPGLILQGKISKFNLLLRGSGLQKSSKSPRKLRMRLSVENAPAH